MEIDIGSIVINADSVPPTSFKIVDKFRASYYAVPIGSNAVTLSEAPRLTPLSTTVYQARLFNPFPMSYVPDRLRQDVQRYVGRGHARKDAICVNTTRP